MLAGTMSDTSSTEAEALGAPADAITVEGLTKSFPRRKSLPEIVREPFARAPRAEALRGVTLSIRRGEMFGLLGPNGAGKTTLLKVLCGLVLPEGGRAEVLGVPVASAALTSVLGLVHGEERSFYWRLTARENLAFFARLYGMSRAERHEKTDRLLRMVGLDGDADRRFSDFSSGMRQRMAIARALIADPRVLLMDEPTRSLDPVNAASLREWLAAELHARGDRTIVLATHNLREAESLCDRIAVISRGRVVALGTPDELRRKGLGSPVYRVSVSGPLPSGSQAGISVVARHESPGSVTLDAKIEAGGSLDGLIAWARSDGGTIEDVRPLERDLEDVFQDIVATDRAAAQREAGSC